MRFFRHRRPYGRLSPASTGWRLLVGAALSLVIAACAAPARAQGVIGVGGSGTPLPMTHGNVITQHNDNQRTGVNPNETILTPAAVQSGFGLLYKRTLDAAVYGQPLFVSDINVTNIYTNTTSFHKGVVIAATANNSIYAYDASDPTGASDIQGSNAGPLWVVNFNVPAQSILPVPGDDIIDQFGNPQQDIQPIIGIVGTPVIDPTTSTLYVLVRTKQSDNYYQELHAIDITTGMERANSPLDLGSISAPGTGDGTDGNGNVDFDPLYENQRAGLLLVPGTSSSGGLTAAPARSGASPESTTGGGGTGGTDSILYVAWGAHGDVEPYHGWIVSVDAATMQVTNVFNTTPNASYSYIPGDPSVGGAIDMSGAGPVVDSSGNVYFATGIGLFDATATSAPNNDYAESVLKLNSALQVQDYFTPFNYQELNNLPGLDLGTGGVVSLPDSVGSESYPHLLAAGGSEGRVYLLSRDGLGGLDTTLGAVSDTQIVASLVNATGPIYGAPAFFNGRLYYQGVGDVLRTFQVNPNVPYLTNGPIGTDTFAYPGASPSISSNGTQNGIVWEIESLSAVNGNLAILHAYDAGTLQTLFSSSAQGGADVAGAYVQFTSPTVADGLVFVGADGELDVYGLKNKSQTQGMHYAVSGPVAFEGVDEVYGNLIQAWPALTANRAYQFSITALGLNGQPLAVTQTAIVYLIDGFTGQVHPLTSVQFNNQSNITLTAHFRSGLWALVVQDSAARSGSGLLLVNPQTSVGFDHYVLRAPRSAKNGAITEVSLTAENYLNVPVPLPGDILAVYDTLPAGNQPYSDQAGGLSLGFLPPDPLGMTDYTATSTPPNIEPTGDSASVGLSYEFQWGFGDYTVWQLPFPPGGSDISKWDRFASGGPFTEVIPVLLHGTGRHVVIVEGLASGLASPVPIKVGGTTTTILNNYGTTATAVINVSP